VLDAVIELFAEDSLEPAAAEVADRSGVSLRSVYRYFEDMDGLVRAAIAHNLVRIEPLVAIDGLGEGPLPDRIDRMVSGRIRLFEHVGPIMRATLLRVGTNEILRDQLDANRRALRAQVEAMFAPELVVLPAAERREVAASLDVLLAFPSVEHLRQTRGFSGSETARVLGRALAAVLG
jgi:AcrR family transcriptional regulator